MRWERLDEEFAEILQVISRGELDEYGKTNKTTERRASMPPLLWADLQRWRSALRAWGHPARDVDFVFPGNLGGKTRGKLDEATGAVHLTKNQCQKWCSKFFVPAVKKVTERRVPSDPRRHPILASPRRNLRTATRRGRADRRRRVRHEP